MLITSTRLIGTLVLSMQTGRPIGRVVDTIVNPDNLKVIAFRLAGSLIPHGDANILDVYSIRDYFRNCFVVDDIDELVAPTDVVKIAKVLELNFDLIGLKVETKKGSKLGKVIDYTVSLDNLTVQQIIVRRPALKSFIDPELIIHRKEIVKITDYKVIIKDEEKVIKAKAEKENFVPNFVNPFRDSRPGFAPADTETPADKDKQ